jgi:hypothetical protein
MQPFPCRLSLVTTKGSVFSVVTHGGCDAVNVFAMDFTNGINPWCFREFSDFLLESSGDSGHPLWALLIVPGRETLGFTFMLLFFWTRPSPATLGILTMACLSMAQIHHALDCFVNISLSGEASCMLSKDLLLPLSNILSLSFPSLPFILSS